MNDIQVGDRVRGIRSGNDWVVMGIDGNMAWLKSDGGEYTERFCKVLTRIEPEPVTVTPKYAVGQRVRSTLTGTIYTIEALVRTTYRTTTGCYLDESNLEPVPTPCPKCKGSGKASE